MIQFVGNVGVCPLPVSLHCVRCDTDVHPCRHAGHPPDIQQKKNIFFIFGEVKRFNVFFCPVGGHALEQFSDGSVLEIHDRSPPSPCRSAGSAGLAGLTHPPCPCADSLGLSQDYLPCVASGPAL